MNCGMKLIKYLLFIFNVIFLIFAFVLIGVGAGVEIKYRPVVQVTEGAISSAPVLLLCIGIFILFVSLFGCLGAYRESYCMILTFAVMMGLMLILEIAAAATAYSLRGRIEDYLSTSFDKAVSSYEMKGARPLDFLQTHFHCCGGEGYQDWHHPNSTFQHEAAEKAARLNISTPGNFTIVPDSCCIKQTDGCGLRYNVTDINEQGCVAAIESKFNNNIASVGGVALTIMFIEVFGLIFAYALMRTIAAQYETVD